jgi:hypothetical protein
VPKSDRREHSDELGSNEGQDARRSNSGGGVCQITMFPAGVSSPCREGIMPPVYSVVENEISDVQSYLKDYTTHARDMIKASDRVAN